MLREAPRPALWLAAAGLIPFIGLTAAVGFAPFVWSVRALVILINYGAVVLSFVGAVHWGLGLQGPEHLTWKRLGLSIVPAAIAWGAVNMYPIPALLTLAFGFFLAFMLDVRAANEGVLPLWYKVMRRGLTTVVMLSLGVTLVVIAYLR